MASIIPRTFTPSQVARACFVQATTLRGWHSGAHNPKDPSAVLLFEGEIGLNGRRRYSIRDVVAIFLVVRLSGADGSGLGRLHTSAAITLSNALRPFIAALDDEAAAYAVDALAHLDALRPLALARPAPGPAGWTIERYQSAEDLRIAAGAGARGIGTSGAVVIDMAETFKAAVVAIMRPGITAYGEASDV